MDEVEEGGVLNKRKKKNCYLTCKKIEALDEEECWMKKGLHGD